MIAKNLIRNVFFLNIIRLTSVLKSASCKVFCSFADKLSYLKNVIYMSPLGFKVDLYFWWKNIKELYTMFIFYTNLVVIFVHLLLLLLSLFLLIWGRLSYFYFTGKLGRWHLPLSLVRLKVVFHCRQPGGAGSSRCGTKRFRVCRNIRSSACGITWSYQMCFFTLHT